MKKSIKDLIYFDYDKAKSINSQLNGGIISELTRAMEEEGCESAEIGFDIKVLKGKIGGVDKEKSIRTEKVELYHELLNKVEQTLDENNILTNLNDSLNDDSFNDFLDKVPSFTFIKSKGWCAFEDFERFKKIMSNFNEIQRLIQTSVIGDTPEIEKFREQIIDLKIEIRQSTKPNKNIEQKKLQAIEKSFDKVIVENVGDVFFDELFVERLKVFLDTFSPNRLNFRLAPFDIYNDFQILASLKSKYLVNGNFEDVIFTYGSRPNIKLSVLGIITSCPQKEDKRIDLIDEFLAYSDDELADEAAFEKAFRKVFSSFEAFEKFLFVPTYPKIAISPIAIYQEVEIK